MAEAARASGAGVRLRVVFDDPRELLSKYQRREGLSRSWFLLRSEEIATIGQFANHLHSNFALQESCPHGIVLSMDDFVLPLSESTCLLKENDVIRVRRKKVKLDKVLESSQKERLLHSLEHKEHPITHQDVHVETAEAHKSSVGNLVQNRELELLEGASFRGDTTRHGYDDGTCARDIDGLDVHGYSGKDPLQQSGTTSLEEEQEKSRWNGTASKKTRQNHNTGNITNGTVCNAFDSGPSEKQNAEGEKLQGSSIDLEKLQPLNRLPKVDDIVAYRLLEPSTWGSKLSPLRVGKVSSFDSITKDIVLIPVPEYPIFPGKNVEDGGLDLQSNISPYKEDGSLKIEYSHLIDVQLLMIGNPEAAVLNSWDVSLVKDSRPNEGLEQRKLSEANSDCWNEWANNKPANQPLGNNQANNWMSTQVGLIESGNVCTTGTDPVSTLNYTGSRGRNSGRRRGRGHRDCGRGLGRGRGRDNSASFGRGYGRAPSGSYEQMKPSIGADGVPDGDGEQMQHPVEESEAQQSGWEAHTNKWNPWPQQSKPSNMPSWHDRVANWMLPPNLLDVNGWSDLSVGLDILPGSGGPRGPGLETLYGAAARGRARGREASSCRGRGRNNGRTM